uniref:Immunoglobulin V-set domain-containing protein n=1 Tax=Timema tahoe TaxID=61484 RepID=A0A7R9NVP1_9NEOP|nr:unnamed protein product [Timema tahoe]
MAHGIAAQGLEIPIYIWYDSYPTHSGEGYEGRVSRVSPDSPYGLASLNLTNIRESDQGWYECKVVFLNRSPNQHKNGTWFHLDVHGEERQTGETWSCDMLLANNKISASSVRAVLLKFNSSLLRPLCTRCSAQENQPSKINSHVHLTTHALYSQKQADILIRHCEEI